jgi:hypothetical protein
MKTYKIKTAWVMSLLLFLGAISFTHAQTADLATHQPTVSPPVGATFEWHNALPVSSGNLMTASQISSASSGLYYGVYNYGTCYSSPSFLRVATNTCPVTTANLTTLVDSTAKPAGMFVSYHSGDPATSTNRISNSAAQTTSAGTYFVTYYDPTSLCFTGVSPIVIVNTPCNTLTITQPPTITKPVNTLVSGTAPTDLLPTGGTGTINYTNGSLDPLCVAPVGANPLPASSNLLINSTLGGYSYTTPTTPGTYYFCVKVCDSASPTPECKMAIYKVTVTGTACNAGTVAPGVN